jgi:hypothetical protein
MGNVKIGTLENFVPVCMLNNPASFGIPKEYILY